MHENWVQKIISLKQGEMYMTVEVPVLSESSSCSLEARISSWLAMVASCSCMPAFKTEITSLLARVSGRERRCKYQEKIRSERHLVHIKIKKDQHFPMYLCTKHCDWEMAAQPSAAQHLLVWAKKYRSIPLMFTCHIILAEHVRQWTDGDLCKGSTERFVIVEPVMS